MEFELDLPNKPIDSEIFDIENKGFTLYIRDGKLYISGNCSQAEAQAMLDSHNPPTPTEPTIEEKLASVGINFEELKAAILGGGN